MSPGQILAGDFFFFVKDRQGRYTRRSDRPAGELTLVVNKCPRPRAVSTAQATLGRPRDRLPALPRAPRRYWPGVIMIHVVNFSVAPVESAPDWRNLVGRGHSAGHGWPISTIRTCS